jgi:hypothetical protein
VANKFKKKNTEEEDEDGLDLEDDEVEESVEDIIRSVNRMKMLIFMGGGGGLGGVFKGAQA